MSHQEELARRYRQRLALYPRAYRREHEEEMLAVPLECARPGQEFPRAVESLDLIWGALRIRLRLLQPYEGNVGSDALAGPQPSPHRPRFRRFATMSEPPLNLGLWTTHSRRQTASF